MKILFVSDLHPDFEMMGVSRYEEVEEAIKQSVSVAIDEMVDWYIMLGDLTNPDRGGRTMRAIRLLGDTFHSLVRKEIRCIAIAGNHDVCTDGTGLTSLTPLRMLEHLRINTLPAIYIVEKPRRIATEVKDISFLCLPYVAPSHAYDVEQTVKNLWYKKMIVLSHLMLSGIHPGSETKDMPRGRDMNYPFCVTKDAYMRVSGHYHKRQIFDPKDGGPPIRIVGSLCRLAFGEEDNEPGFLLVEV